MWGIFKNKLLSSKPGVIGFLYSLRKAYLTKSAKKHYAQFGEDIILKEWIKKEKNNGFYVDVGCYHPKKCSNTYQLFKRGWRGINIDLSPLKINTFNFLRPQDHNVVAAVSSEDREMSIYHDSLYSLGATVDQDISEKFHRKVVDVKTIKTQTLGAILEKSPFKDKEIDLLSIDAEGHDFDVLCSFDLAKYKPKVILIEHHARDIDDILNTNIYQFLKKNNYQLANWTGHTLFFVSSACDFLTWS